MADLSQMDFPLTLHGQPVTLIASCLGDGDTGGGLLYYNCRTWICIDDVSTTGLYVANDELVRVLWAPSQVASGTSVLHYTCEGLARQVTVDELTDPHDILWDGEHYIAVSSLLDSVLWITPEGTVTKCAQFARGNDCWHLNSLLISEGVLYATAFGRFENPRGWAEHPREGSGILFRLNTGADVVSGLYCPHTPRFESGQWVICESMKSRLSVFDADGTLASSIQLQDWVRGLAVTDRYILVGESVNRQQTDEVRGATIAVLDRRTWAVLGRFQLPFREVYDLVLVSPRLLDGIVKSPNARVVASCPPELLSVNGD